MDNVTITVNDLISSFIELTDAPHSYADKGDFFVKVNSAETALEFVSDKFIYSQIANKVLSNSTTETSMFNDTGARGTRVIPADTLKVGDIIKIKSYGLLGSTGTPSSTLKVKMNSVELLGNTMAITTATQGLHFDFESFLVIRAIGATGKITGYTKTFFKALDSVTAGLSRVIQTSGDVTINTTIDQTIDVTYKWSVASTLNNVTSINFTIEIV